MFLALNLDIKDILFLNNNFLLFPYFQGLLLKSTGFTIEIVSLRIVFVLTL